MSKELRTNERIKVREVRLIDDQGNQLGVLSIQEALDLAQARNLDLVEMAPNANPPVCKLLDFGRYKYEQTKREREARKGQKTLILKEIWFRPNVDDHDRLFKTKMIQRFLAEGDKVKVTVRFRGRELAHPEAARILLNTVAEDIRLYAAIEKLPTMDGKSMTMIVAPTKTPPKATPGPGQESDLARAMAAASSVRPTPAPAGSNGRAPLVSQPVQPPEPVKRS
ncbi:MAG: translation initiation factor IF-3 [Chloroflexota bacterium]|nr:translation initiation factor IF-3 [Chloroflexota bacterium]